MPEQFVGRFDFVQFEAVRNQRLQIDPTRFDDRHESAHALLAAGTERGHDLVVAETGREGIQRDPQIGRVDAEAGERASGPENAQGVLERALGS